MNNVLAVILAGGKGSRLEPLTRDRAKPAVPFGGLYRIIDFALSNCVNSGLKRVVLLTQYKAMSLDRHVNAGWRNYFCRELGELIDILPPQQRLDEQWYQGTADAVYQNIYSLEMERPEYVVVLAGDHIYKMNYRKMVDFHIAQKADVTVGALRVKLNEGRSFGVMQVDPENRILSFDEKPELPQPVPGDPEHCLASMGIYIFGAEFLFEQLCQDNLRKGSAHDFGRNIVPHLVRTDHRVFAFPFMDENRKSQAYWRDVGTIDAYYDANMDLAAVDPLLNLYDEQWPIRTNYPMYPAPKFVFAGDEPGRRGEAWDSIVCPGAIISGGHVQHSVIGPAARVNSFAHVEDSILFESVTIGRRSRVRRAIIDKGVSIPPGVSIGYDHELDRQRGFTISEGGIVVLAKGDEIEVPRATETLAATK